MEELKFTRSDSDFMSSGVRCGGWLYKPEGSTNPPVVVMAHGFAAERTFRLPAFAEKFIERGVAAFLFDYRCFGSSDGEPRQLVDHMNQLDDWEAAIKHVRSLDGINKDKLAIWGSSFSGGHVIATAAQVKGISAVVSQVPFVGEKAEDKPEIGFILRSLYSGARDMIRKWTGRKPYYIPVLGEPGSFGLMTTPESLPGYMAIVPEDSKWENKCPARVFFSIGSYRPIEYADKIKCPTLLIAADEDSLIPVDHVEKMASKIENCTYVHINCNHFEPYVGEKFQEFSKIEADFLEKHLL